jgi:hypothetical protein
MKTKITSLLLASFLITSIYSSDDWNNLPRSEQTEILLELEYINAPVGTEKVVLINSASDAIPVDETYQGSYQDYINNMIEEYHDKVSTEGIEQSPYPSYGAPVITELILLIDANSKKVLGANMYVFQDGRDEDGAEADVNWGVNFQTDENAQALEDFYYFEWTGH